MQQHRRRRPADLAVGALGGLGTGGFGSGGVGAAAAREAAAGVWLGRRRRRPAVAARAAAGSNSSNSGGSPSPPAAFAASATAAAFTSDPPLPTGNTTPSTITPALPGPRASPAVAGGGKVGVLLLNLGGPETLDDVRPFLYNLFADPDIIRLPPAFKWLQPVLASLIATLRAPKSAEGYRAIGGGSPLRRITEEQAVCLERALRERGLEGAGCYVAMRYWAPYTEEALAQVVRDGVKRLVILPLYPQFSISTSGSSLRLLEQLLRQDPGLAALPHTVIPSWYQRPGYVGAMADLIEQELSMFGKGAEEGGEGGGGHGGSSSGGGRGGQAASAAAAAAAATAAAAAAAAAASSTSTTTTSSPPPTQTTQTPPHLFFSAHGVPKSYVEEAGDPYKEEMEECVGLIVRELERRRLQRADPRERPLPFTLAYQSRVGPVEWLKPYTDDSIRDLALNRGVKRLLAVPVSFVSEHIETLEEMDVEYRDLAEASGVEEWRRVPALNTHPRFIGDLADAVVEALPYVGCLAATGVTAAQMRMEAAQQAAAQQAAAAAAAGGGGGASSPPPPAFASGSSSPAAAGGAATVPASNGGGGLVPMGDLEALLDAYDRGRDRTLPAPVGPWEWGWTKSAETWNGRLAMVALAVVLLLEAATGQGVLSSLLTLD
jgi:protoporphyrin/coproporphyrin ferrochelatase